MKRRALLSLAALAAPSFSQTFGWKQLEGVVRDERTSDEAQFTAATARAQWPTTVDLSARMPQAYMQALTNDCTANAFDAVMYFLGNGFQGSRLFIYWNARDKYGITSKDWSVSLKDCVDVLTQLGTCRETLWPYDPVKFKKRPTGNCFIDARKHKASQGLRLNTLDDYLGCLADGFPFVFAAALYGSFNSVGGRTGYVPMPAQGETPQKLHALVACGYDMRNRYVKCLMDGGTGFGLNGYVWMPFDYFTDSTRFGTPLVYDAWTLR